jgi:ribonuclease R
MSRRLAAMVRDGQLLTNRQGRYCLTDHLPVVIGRVAGHRDGFGFLIPDDGGEDLFLAPRQMRLVMHGDRAAVRPRMTRGDRREATLVEVLERGRTELVGRYVRERGLGFVVPEDSRITHTMALLPGKTGGAKPGQIVVAEIVEYPDRDTQPVGRVIDVLGEAGAPGVETEMAIRAHGLPHAWPDDVLEEAASKGAHVASTHKRGRLDLRGLPLVTIDGADAKDFDDAVYAEPTRTGWRLLVAIADVAHYVSAGGALDEEARERGTSVYFARGVLPMLPETLSNGLCSLNPKVDRLCMVCEMWLDDKGRVTRSRFHEGVMRSAARLTYEQVARAMEDGDPEVRRELESVAAPLGHLYDVYRALAGARRRRGAVDFELPEIKVRFDDAGNVAALDPTHRRTAHKVIEECMIAANVQAAGFLRRHKVPCLYRVHAGPEEEKLERLNEFLEAFGLRLRPGKVKPADFRKIREAVAGQPEESLVESVLLRSMSQAVYQPNNIGHFGLALEEYAHFTSPIRRYPDLLVHRGIRHVLRGGKPRDFGYGRSDMEGLGRHCSHTERRADDATREAMDWLKCEFMVDKIGETYRGLIAGVTNFGIFVQIPELQVDGLVHVSQLGPDYFKFDPAGHCLAGERTGARFRLADAVTVRVARVDMEERQIDFELADQPPRTRRR